jgi:hypothetical protein
MAAQDMTIDRGVLPAADCQLKEQIAHKIGIDDLTIETPASGILRCGSCLCEVESTGEWFSSRYVTLMNLDHLAQ